MRAHGARALLALLVAVGSLDALGAEYYLQARPLTRAMPDGQVVPLWGYALDEDGDFTTPDSPARVPGPALVVPPGDDTLVVHLSNGLPEPTSLVIAGQPGELSPTWVDPVAGVLRGSRPAGNVTARVRSFAAEVEPGAVRVYTWSGLKPGTYLYQSGTHPAVQVQMGLYGAMTKDAAPGQAYPGVPYEAALTLLFSEVDPALHEAVATGNYGPGRAVTSTLGYRPRYFLINGEPYSATVPPLPAGRVGQRVLLRLLNAGQEPRVPVLQGAHLTLLAEDGNPLPYVREQYSVLLPAGAALDALWVPAAAGQLPLYDRRLGLTNGTQPGGGMLRFLTITP